MQLGLCKYAEQLLEGMGKEAGMKPRAHCFVNHENDHGRIGLPVHEQNQNFSRILTNDERVLAGSTWLKDVRCGTERRTPGYCPTCFHRPPLSGVNGCSTTLIFSDDRSKPSAIHTRHLIKCAKLSSWMKSGQSRWICASGQNPFL